MISILKIIKENILTVIIIILILIAPFFIILLLQMLQIVSDTWINFYIYLVVILIFFYLMVTGKVSKVKIMGFEVTLQELKKVPAESILKKKAEEIVDIREITEKDTLEKLKSNIKRYIEEGKKVLNIKREEAHRYDKNVIKAYLTTNIFKYVVFTDEGKFSGFIDSKILLGLFNFEEKVKTMVRKKWNESENEQIINQIQEWKIEKIPGVITAKVQKTATLETILKCLVRKRIDAIAVVDSKEKFEGIINKSTIEQLIIRELLLGDSCLESNYEC